MDDLLHLQSQRSPMMNQYMNVLTLMKTVRDSAFHIHITLAWMNMIDRESLSSVVELKVNPQQLFKKELQPLSVWWNVLHIRRLKNMLAS